MYALFFEDTQETAGVFHSKNQALVVGRLLSQERGRSVVGVFNRPDGSTAICCKFEDGAQTFDGGCCGPAWVPVDSHSLPTPDNEDIAHLTAAGR